MCAKSLSSGATPFFEPINNHLELNLSLLVVGLEVVARDVSLDEVSPVFLTIPEEPLVASSHNALVSSSRNNFTFRLVVRHSLIGVQQMLSNDWFCLLN